MAFYLFAFFWWDRANDLSCKASTKARQRLFKSASVASVFGNCAAVPFSNSSCTRIEIANFVILLPTI